MHENTYAHERQDLFLVDELSQGYSSSRRYYHLHYSIATHRFNVDVWPERAAFHFAKAAFAEFAVTSPTRMCQMKISPLVCIYKITASRT